MQNKIGVGLIYCPRYKLAYDELQNIITINEGYKYTSFQKGEAGKIARYKVNKKGTVIKSTIKVFDVSFDSEDAAEQALKSVLFNKELEKYNKQNQT